MTQLRRPAAALLCFLPLAAGGCGRESAAAPPPAYDAAAHQAAWDKWKAGRAEFVSTPGRPISYTGLTWLHEGANPVGSARDNRVVLAGRDVPAHLGVLLRRGDTVRFEPAAGTHATVDSQPAVAGALRTDADTTGASVVRVGSAGFRVLKRVDSIGVRSWDAEHPLLKAHPSLQYFPLDSGWRQVARFEPLATPQRVPIMTELGVPEEHVIIGTTHARIGDSTYALTTFLGTGPTDVHIVFADASSGDETYGFRFVHAPLDTVAKTVTLDFNFAYNPDCAFSPYTTCPLPPRGNHIKTKILAGEKKFVHDSL